jgi:hypothetical protein
MSTSTLESTQVTPALDDYFETLSLRTLSVEPDDAASDAGFDDAASDTDTLAVPDSDALPPRAAVPFTEHAYALTSRAGRAWATLRVRSRARAPGHRPYFFQGDAIAGAVELDLARPDHIRAVEVEVRTRLTGEEGGRG